MANTIAHFEIYGEHPITLADCYRKAFGWQVEQMPVSATLLRKKNEAMKRPEVPTTAKGDV